MESNKTPGTDGIPAEFYKIFWNDIKSFLLASINASYAKGLLSISKRRGFNNFNSKKRYILPPLHNRTHEQHFEAWARRSARPMIHFINSHKYSSNTVNLNAPSDSRTRKPQKTTFGKNRDRVPPTYALVLPSGFKVYKTKRIKQL